MKVLIAVSPAAAAAAGGGGSPLLAFYGELGDLQIELAFMEDSVPLAEQVADVDVIIPAVSEIDADVINAATNLKLIVQAGVGLDTVDIDAATKRNVYVANAPYGSATSMGELTIALMLLLSRKLNEAQAELRKGVFFLPLGSELGGKILGLIGLGHSGKEAAKRAKSFDMNVMAIDKFHEQIDSPDVDHLGGIEELDKILTESDFVSLHCALTDETRHMIGERELRMMQPHAILVNTARGEVIDEPALCRALKEGWIAAAALDVMEKEPPDQDNPLLRMDNVVVTPHMSAYMHRWPALQFEASLDKILDLAHGRWPMAAGPSPW